MSSPARNRDTITLSTSIFSLSLLPTPLRPPRTTNKNSENKGAARTLVGVQERGGERLAPAVSFPLPSLARRHKITLMRRPLLCTSSLRIWASFRRNGTPHPYLVSASISVRHPRWAASISVLPASSGLVWHLHLSQSRTR